MKRLLNRPSKINELHEVNHELEKIYDLINNLSLSVNIFDDSKNNKGKAGDLRVSRNKSGNIVLEIRARDGWYSSAEIFTKMKAGE